MILKLYKKNVAIGLILIPVFVFALCVPIFIVDGVKVSYFFYWEENLFYEVLKNSWLNFALTFLIILINSILINRLFNKTIIFNKHTYVPSLLYLLLLSFNSVITFTPELVLQMLLILSFGELIKLDQNKEVIHFVFKASLLLGVTLCLSPYYFPFVFGLLVVLLNFKLFHFKDWIGILVGVLIPLIYLTSSMFLFANSIDFGEVSDYVEYDTKNQLLFYIKISLLFFIILVGLVPLRKFYFFAITDIKKQLYIFIVFFIVGLISSVIGYFVFHQSVFPFLIPLSFLITISVINSKDDTFISLLLTLALIVNIVALYVG